MGTGALLWALICPDVSPGHGLHRTCRMPIISTARRRSWATCGMLLTHALVVAGGTCRCSAGRCAWRRAPCSPAHGLSALTARLARQTSSTGWRYTPAPCPNPLLLYLCRLPMPVPASLRAYLPPRGPCRRWSWGSAWASQLPSRTVTPRGSCTEVRRQGVAAPTHGPTSGSGRYLPSCGGCGCGCGWVPAPCGDMQASRAAPADGRGAIRLACGAARPRWPARVLRDRCLLLLRGVCMYACGRLAQPSLPPPPWAG